jgi:hypothetical protein
MINLMLLELVIVKMLMYEYIRSCNCLAKSCREIGRVRMELIS